MNLGGGLKHTNVEVELVDAAAQPSAEQVTIAVSLPDALRALIEAVEYTPQGVRAIEALETGPSSVCSHSSSSV